MNARFVDDANYSLKNLHVFLNDNNVKDDVCFDSNFIYLFVRDIDMKIDIHIKTFHIVIMKTEVLSAMISMTQR